MTMHFSRRFGGGFITASLLAVVQWSAATTLAAISLPSTAHAQQVGSAECTISTSPIPVVATLNADLSIDKSTIPKHRAISAAVAAGDEVCLDADAPHTTSHFCHALLSGEVIGPNSWTARRMGSSVTSARDYLSLMPISLQSTPVKTDFQTGDQYLSPQGGTYMQVLFAEGSSSSVAAGEYMGTIPVQSTVTFDPYNQSNYCSDIESTAYYVVPGTVTYTFVIMVPQACTATIPTELNFGQIASTAVSHTATAQVITRCNSDDLKYNIYITGGTGTANDNLTMTDGAGGALTYGLYMDETRATPFQRTPMGASVDQDGPYTRSFDGHTATIYGQVPAQALPQAGAYSDVVTVHVEY